jgi:hypothetical protein
MSSYWDVGAITIPLLGEIGKGVLYARVFYMNTKILD